MCGIIFGANFDQNKEDPVNEFINMQLQDQLPRGKEGFGLVFLDKNKKIKTERATELTKVLFDLHQNPSNIILAHHRQPTSSKNLVGQTHPITVNHGSLSKKYLVVHNGIIHNEEVLRKEHIDDLGFNYTTDRDLADNKFEFNDSEALAIEVARYLNGQTKKIEAKGSIAFIALEIDKKTDKVINIHFCRNTSPLNMSKTRGKLRLSSEGEGEEIKENTLYTCDTKEFKLRKKKCILQTYSYTPVTYHQTPYKYPKYNVNTNDKEDKEDREDDIEAPFEIKSNSPHFDNVSDANLPYDDKDADPYYDYESETSTIMENLKIKVLKDMEDLIDSLEEAIGDDPSAENHLEDYVERITEEVSSFIIDEIPGLTTSIKNDLIIEDTYDQKPIGYLSNEKTDTKASTETA